MDVSQQLDEYAAQRITAVLERPNPIEVDAGLLTAFDNSPVEPTEYSANLEPHLLALTLTSTQSLLSTLFTLPTVSSEHGPVATLPAATTLLPREKPLPKPKPQTKWERFANAKGISHRKKEKGVWDEERQEWVSRWGRDGKNREAEEQWIHEIKGGADPNIDPRATARAERKARVTKNLRQQARNVAEAASATAPSPVSALGKKPTSGEQSQADKAAGRTKRKAELERTMLVSKTSTASLGRFDKKIEGEPRAKGIKRKFESNVGDFSNEKDAAMTVLGKLGTAERKRAPKKGGEGVEGGLNVRKAVRQHGREERAKAKFGGGGAKRPVKRK